VLPAQAGPEARRAVTAQPLEIFMEGKSGKGQARCNAHGSIAAFEAKPMGSPRFLLIRQEPSGLPPPC